MANPMPDNVKKLITYAKLLGVTHNELYSVAARMRHEEKRQRDLTRLAQLTSGVKWEIVDGQQYRVSSNTTSILVKFETANKRKHQVHVPGDFYEYTVYRINSRGDKRFLHSKLLPKDFYEVPLTLVPKRDKFLLASLVILEYVSRWYINR